MPRRAPVKPPAKKPARSPAKKPEAKPAPVADAPEPAAEEKPSPRSRAAQTIRISTEVAGKIVGLSGRQLQNLKIEGCPLPEGGVRTIDEIAAIVRWRMDQIREDAGDDRDIDELEIEEKRTALKVKQLKLARELDLVLDADEYLHHLSTLWAEMNSVLDVMGMKLGRFLVGINDKEVIEEKIDAYVAEIKKQFNPEEAMNPIRMSDDTFGDGEIEIDLDSDDGSDDDD